jgi:excisionase family DNA binding protein
MSAEPTPITEALLRAPDMTDDRRAVLHEVVREALGPFADRPWVKVSELAAWMGCAESTIYVSVSDGTIPSVRVGGSRGRIVIPVPALAALLLGAATDRAGP